MPDSGSSANAPSGRTNAAHPVLVFAVMLVALLGALPLAGTVGGLAVSPARAHGPTLDLAGASLRAASTSLSLGAGPARGTPAFCTSSGTGPATCAAGVPAAPHPLAGTTPVWTNLTDSLGGVYPSNRWIASMAYDPVDQYVVLFGGYGGSIPPDSDTWAFANGQWTQLSPSLSPPGRYAGTMTWDALDGYLLLFSGYAYQGSTFVVLNDTWTFLHGQWTNVTNYSDAPPARWRAVLAYDPVDQYVVMFGGTDLASTPLSDTWAYAGGNWTKLTVTGNPPGRYRADAAWDAADGYMVVFGGCTSTTCPSQDTWTYVNKTWTSLNPATKPAAREYVGMTYDPVNGYVVMTGGTNGATTFYSDTWSFQNKTWSSLSEPTHPNSRAYSAMAWDPLDGFGVLFGGATSTSGGFQNDTWALGPSILAQLRVSPSLIDLGQSATLNATPIAYAGYASFNWTVLPAGCSAGNVSVVPCTPSATGTYPISVAINDSGGVPLVRNASVTVNTDPAITQFTAVPSTVTVGTPFELVVRDNGGGTLPYTYSYAGLPGGCSSRSANNLSCTPTASGPFTVNATLSDAAGWHAHAIVLVTVNPKPSLVSFVASPATIDAGQTATLYANVTGGTAPLSYVYSGLPSGCASFNLSAIGCTPLGTGVVTVGVTVTDAFGWNATGLTTLTVNPAVSVSAFAVSAPAIDVGQTVKFWLNATGGTGSLLYAYSGAPGGCTLAAASTATCTPSSAGTFTVSGTVTDSLGMAVESNVTLTVNADPLESAVAVAPGEVDVHQPAVISPTVTGGTAPLSYRYTGLPTGCATADTPTLTCQPSVSGTFSVVVTVTDRWGQATQLGGTLSVNPAPTVSSFTASSPSVTTGSSTTFTVVAVGGSGVYSYRYGGLPTGCASANASTLACAPTATGSFVVTVEITDSLGLSANASVNVTVAAPSPGGSLLGLSGSMGYLVIGALVAVVVVVAAVALLLRRRRAPPASEAPAEEPVEETA